MEERDRKALRKKKLKAERARFMIPIVIGRLRIWWTQIVCLKTMIVLAMQRMQENLIPTTWHGGTAFTNLGDICREPCILSVKNLMYSLVDDLICRYQSNIHCYRISIVGYRTVIR
jgi:hypothetical protein